MNRSDLVAVIANAIDCANNDAPSADRHYVAQRVADAILRQEAYEVIARLPRSIATDVATNVLGGES